MLPCSTPSEVASLMVCLVAWKGSMLTTSIIPDPSLSDFPRRSQSRTKTEQRVSAFLSWSQSMPLTFHPALCCNSRRNQHLEMLSDADASVEMNVCCMRNRPTSFHLGFSVLFCTCVVKTFSSLRKNSQYGSLLPLRSAERRFWPSNTSTRIIPVSK